MIQLLLILLGLVSNPSDVTAKSNNGNTIIQTQQTTALDTGGEDGHPIPPRIIGG